MILFVDFVFDSVRDMFVCFFQVHNIVDKACKEMAMEKMLRDLEVTSLFPSYPYGT